jgi:beta-glucanase (GH16 family)
MKSLLSVVPRVWLPGAFVFLCGAPLVAQVTVDNWSPGPGWNLVWADEFTGNAVNTTHWTYDLGAGGWGNNELETYTTANATVQDGELRITAQKNADGSYTSARLKTQDRLSWTYGKFAARMRLPAGQGIWPAFWMLGTNITTAGWPKCGEIDVMEMIGGGEDRDDSVYGTIHWDAGGHAATGSSRIELVDPEIFHDDYHVFEVEWTPAVVIWRIDGVETARTSIDRTAQPDREEFHRPFFLVLNLAVGGNWPGAPDASTVFPQVLAVDWVRVYTSEATASAPVFTAQPSAATVAAGGSASFSVTVSGQPEPTLQWQRDGVNLPGATSATLKLSNVTAADAGSYRVIATNSAGTTTSDAATLTVTTPAPAPTPAPTSSGGGGGGGAPSVYFPIALAVLGWLRGRGTRWRAARES